MPTNSAHRVHIPAYLVCLLTAVRHQYSHPKYSRPVTSSEWCGYSVSFHLPISEFFPSATDSTGSAIIQKPRVTAIYRAHHLLPTQHLLQSYRRGNQAGSPRSSEVSQYRWQTPGTVAFAYSITQKCLQSASSNYRNTMLNTRTSGKAAS